MILAYIIVFTLIGSILSLFGSHALFNLEWFLGPIKEIKADPNGPFTGVIIESSKDKRRGNIATIIVKSGTLRVPNEFYVFGSDKDTVFLEKLFGKGRVPWKWRYIWKSHGLFPADMPFWPYLYTVF